MWHTLGAPLIQATLSLCVLVSTAWPCVCAFLCRCVCVCVSFYSFFFVFFGGGGGDVRKGVGKIGTNPGTSKFSDSPRLVCFVLSVLSRDAYSIR